MILWRARFWSINWDKLSSPRALSSVKVFLSFRFIVQIEITSSLEWRHQPIPISTAAQILKFPANVCWCHFDFQFHGRQFRNYFLWPILLTYLYSLNYSHSYGRHTSWDPSKSACATKYRFHLWFQYLEITLSRQSHFRRILQIISLVLGRQCNDFIKEINVN